MNLREELVKLWARRDMVRNLVVRDLKIRYKGSTLGFLWSFLNPIIMITLYYLVFGKIVSDFRKDVEGNYGLFLAAGMWPWMMFASSVGKSAPLFILNESLVKKVYFPREILPIATVISEFVNFIIGFTVVIVVLAITGDIFNWYVLLLPLWFALLFMFTLGLSLLVSVWDVYFRDTEQILNSLLTIGFFATPIFYTVAKVQGFFPTYRGEDPMSEGKILLNQTLSYAYFTNPFATLIPYIKRSVLGFGTDIKFQSVLVLTIAAIVFLTLSYLYFKRHEYRLVEEV